MTSTHYSEQFEYKYVVKTSELKTFCSEKVVYGDWLIKTLKIKLHNHKLGAIAPGDVKKFGENVKIFKF